MMIRPYFRLYTSQPIPPLRLIVRTGVGNNIIFPHYNYLTESARIWLHFFNKGVATLDSSIVDIGSGVGKSAVALRDFDYAGEQFRGVYYGFDVDPEMTQWCQEHFPPEHFTFAWVDMHNEVYSPHGSIGNKPCLDCEDGTIDLVFSQSLFSHLLEEDIRHYMSESLRVLKSGGTMSMTFFCMDDLEQMQLLGGRWSFGHRIGPAYVQDKRFPESAIAYRKEWILSVAKSCGFVQARVVLPTYQSTLECIK
jgi:SAM-dependent methyltransferase